MSGFITIVLAFLFCISNYAYSADWIIYASDINDDNYFFDASSISWINDDVVRVWVTVFISEKSRRKTVDAITTARDDEKYPQYKVGMLDLIKRMEKHINTKILYDINCREMTISTRHYWLVDFNGIEYDTHSEQVLKSENDRNKFIRPDTTMENLYKTVCADYFNKSIINNSSKKKMKAR